MDQHNHDHKHDKPEHPHPHNHHAGGSHGDAEKKHPEPDQQKPAGHSDEARSRNSDAKAGEQTAAQPAEGQQQTKDKEKIADLESRLAAANDKYLRLMAEFDNFKRRTAKEYQQLIEQANEKLIKDIIDVRENFERAFKTHKEGADPKPFVDGMKMIFSKLDGVLHKHGLEVYSEAGQEFDPQLHDAMMKSPHETVPEHHIAEVCEKGYRLRGKVIKHSKVIVSSGKPSQVEEKKAAASCADTGDETVFEVSVEPKENGTTNEKAGA
jgi:molecular chaperone GrpE